MATDPRNWSQTLEDFLDDRDLHSAQQLLEGIVRDLENSPDSSTNLSLAAALTDLASVYRSLGLSIKADSCSTSAFLIKKRAEAISSSPADYKASDSLTESLKKTSDTEQLDEKPKQELSTSASACEEEWETALSQGLLKLDGFATSSKSPESSSQDRVAYKQRGRGAFTYGGMGMYSDRLTVSPDESLQHIANSEEDEVKEASDQHSRVACGVRHVLVVTFPPHVITKDLENLFGPFAVSGVAIRWVNDTTALAVFRNPELAREALDSVKNNPQFKVQELTEDNDLVSIIDEHDLQPPVPRPATSSQAAHRMIMGALRRQGFTNNSANRNSFQQSQKQESERKQRLLMRQKLRDEAWGEDG